MTDSNVLHIGRVTGSLRAIDERRGAVRMEDVFDTDPADLWDAVTDPRRLARWIAEVDGDLRVGGMVQARFTSGRRKSNGAGNGSGIGSGTVRDRPETSGSQWHWVGGGSAGGLRCGGTLRERSGWCSNSS